MTLLLLILHGLCATLLLGALTHQAAACLRGSGHRGTSVAMRYMTVSPRVFINAVVVLYPVTFVLGGVIYPAYRVDVRMPLEEMALGWAVGLFELKEHFASIGLASLPLYFHLWRPAGTAAPPAGRGMLTLVLALLVWFDFVAGHVLNNLRGL